LRDFNLYAPLQELLSLNLSFNAVGDKAIEHIKNTCPALIDLNLACNSLVQMDTLCQELASQDRIKSIFVCPNPFTLNKNWRFSFIKKASNIVYLDGIDIAYEKTLWEKINTIAKDSVAGELQPVHERLK